MADHKVDIFGLLDKLSLGDKDVLSSYTEEEQKTISPLVIMRWLSCTSDPRQIVFLNALVNHQIFAIPKHPGLLFKLMACCTNKQKTRYTWLGQKKTGGTKKLSVQVIQTYYNYSSREAVQYLKILTKEDLIGMAEQLGWDKSELTKLKREL